MLNNKLFTRLISFGLLATAFTGCAAENDTAESPDKGSGNEVVEMTDGIYTASVNGYIAPIEIEGEVKDNSLETLTVKRQQETPGVGEIALDEMPEKIVEHQSTEVDTVTGATITSMAVINATKDIIEQAGGSLSAFEVPVDEEIATEDEYTADVVIVGGGGAGLASAAAAINEGASVVLIEKMGYLGGNSIVSGGIYNAPDPAAQDYHFEERSESLESLIIDATSEEPVSDQHEELMSTVKEEYEEYLDSDKTLFDSPNWFALQTWNAGDQVGELDMVMTLTGESFETLEALKDIGVEFDEDVFHGGGALYPRTHDSTAPNGTAFIDAFKNQIKDNENYTELLEMTGEELITEGNKVVGVKATDKAGNEVTFNANNGVILATGGFAGSVELRQKYGEGDKWSDLGPDVIDSNMAGITGDGLFMAEDIGAELINMEHIQLFPYASPQTGATYDIVIPDGSDMFINKEGERFVREDGRRDVMSQAIIDQTDGMMYRIFSADGIDDLENKTAAGGEKLSYYVENNVAGYVSADTMEELAEKLDVPAEPLIEAVEEFNKYAEANEEDPFGRISYNGPIITPPFFAYPRKPAVHHTMGGVNIDKEARILDKDGSVIEGLYGAGEITGNLHGSNRIGGNAIVDFSVFGRISGISAANNK